MSYDPTVNDLVNEALLLWAEIFNIDVEAKSWSGNLGSWQLRRHAEELSAARDLDTSGLTTFMMLKALLNDQLQRVTVKAIDFLRNHDQVREDMRPLDALLTLLEGEEVSDMVEAFQGSLKAAAAHYGADMEKVEPYIDDLWNSAHIRRDALRSMKTLKAHQFTQGEPEADTLTFNPKVYEFWNINSLIRAMRAQLVPGITLCLIRDPLVLHSYFVFAIKNGDNITILTDQAQSAHPLQKQMARRPDRELSTRAAKHHFPYELLDVTVSEDQKRLYAKARTALVPTGVQAVPLADIKDLAADTIVWLTMVFERIRQRYGAENHQLEELSYTGEMVVDPHALVGETGALVVSGQYKPLDLGTISKEDVSGEIENNWERPGSGFNQWMVDRYGDQVPEEALNLVGERAVESALPSIEQGGLVPDEKDLARYNEWKAKSPGGEVPSFIGNPHLKLESLDPVGFGSKEDLQKDRVWAARYNQATALQRLANVEFLEKREEVYEWFARRVFLNQDALIEAALRGELLLPRIPFRTSLSKKDITGEENALVQRYDRLGNSSAGWMSGNYMPWTAYGGINLGERIQSTGKWECALNGAKATIFSLISPTCPEALAILAGCEVEDLPVFLQHWYASEPYMGNSILDRLDPLDWRLHNPWIPDNRSRAGKRGLTFRVGIALSKSGFHKGRKELGLPRIKVEEVLADE